MQYSMIRYCMGHHRRGAYLFIGAYVAQCRGREASSAPAFSRQDQRRQDLRKQHSSETGQNQSLDGRFELRPADVVPGNGSPRACFIVPKPGVQEEFAGFRHCATLSPHGNHRIRQPMFEWGERRSGSILPSVLIPNQEQFLNLGPYHG